jgi:hypothetical protein
VLDFRKKIDCLEFRMIVSNGGSCKNLASFNELEISIYLSLEKEETLKRNSAKNAGKIKYYFNHCNPKLPL